MQDFAAPNIPAITIRPPSNLPNRHHEAIVSASGNPSVPPRTSSSFSPDRPPIIPPRGSSLDRGINFRRMLEQTAPLRERLSSMGSIQQTFGRGGQGNRVRFQGVNAGEGRSREGRTPAAAPAASSSQNSTIEDGLVRSDSLRAPPPFLIAANNNSKVNTNSIGGGRSTSRASSRRSKDKGKARMGTKSVSSGCDDDDDEISTPMLSLHNIGLAHGEPRTPMVAMPSSGLHVPKSEPRSEDGLPVTPR
ncbi:hypothetical protein PG994_010138 [Apiospora phragmitis]|uniref:Uncharacterized protein n=1 Tax=Apiospora phragmitis TaxID=2905665 RepID=A0ABR1TRQ7_9PEZI